MNRILILSSAAIALAGCSMNGEGTYYGTNFANSNCYNNCAPGATYAVSHQKPAQFGHARVQAPAHYGHAQQPSAHAYGTQVHGTHGQSHHGHQGHGAPKLRGMHGSHRQAYKYGTLGAVMYDTDLDLYGVQGRVGYQSANYLGAELEGSIGLTDQTDTVAGTITETEVDYSVGAFGVARAPVGDRFSVFGRAGYAATKYGFEFDNAGVVTQGSTTFDGIAYGVGAEYAIDPRNSIRLDYTRYDYDEGAGTADSVALAFARKF